MTTAIANNHYRTPTVSQFCCGPNATNLTSSLNLATILAMEKTTVAQPLTPLIAQPLTPLTAQPLTAQPLTPTQIAAAIDLARWEVNNAQVPIESKRAILIVCNLLEQTESRAEKLATGLQPLVTIANAYDANDLDDEARKTWGVNDEWQNTRPPESIELYSNRGGRALLTLADCLKARSLFAG